MDVVIVTLLRSSLRYTLKSVHETIPDPNIILMTEKGILGVLRNEGLMKASSEYVCFVDDDVILSREWYAKCMKWFQENPDLIGVQSFGCAIFRTAKFKARGGYPIQDSDVLVKKYKLGSEIVIEHAGVEHRTTGLSYVLHSVYWLTHGFQSESKVGTNKNPKESLHDIFHFLKQRRPDAAFIQFFWLAKAPFTLPFVLHVHKNRAKP